MPKVASESQHFRSDIQGLRGIAVLLVVIYHTGVAFPGGYIGVDMFFVISGFVITQLLLRETQATGKINLVNFYSRRIRRILPAVSFAIVGTLLLSIFAFSPFGEQQQVAETARASTLFAANLYFYLQDSYWALAENPLRHLWSLAVEEQFYVIFPALLLIISRLKIKIRSPKSVTLLLMIAIVSFLGSFFLSYGEQILPKPELFAFFGTPWRIWQFLAGALIALAPELRKSSGQMRLMITVASITALGWAAMTFDSYTPFPGWAALVPVISTSALLYFSGANNFVTKLLIFRPLTSIGDISYSWYLWHWPLIVFAKRVFPGSEVVAPIGAALLSIPIAVFSLRKIENPIRHNSNMQGKRILQLGMVCIFLPIIFSFGTQKIGDTGLGLTELRNNDKIRSSFSEIRNCSIDSSKKQNSDDCKSVSFGTEAKIMMLVGDSAASSFSDAIADVAKQSGYNFETFYANGCPISHMPLTYREDCASNFEILQQKIFITKPDLLVIANMSDLYVDGSGLGAIIRNFDGQAAKDRYEGLEFWLENWRLMLQNSLSTQKTLIIQQPPLSAMREPILLQKIISSTFEKKSVQKFFDEEISLDNSDTRNMIVAAEADLFKNNENVAVFDPATVLCDTKNCRQTLNGEALYYDSRHLTVKGSLLMVEGIKKALQPLLAKN